nr:probable alpha,alpha-trehalose-phosphate synthase [UDP-forming] 7 [Tanacetum cinerariifolium]
MAEPVMKLYTESTDGSSIETKESALVCWDADPGFGFARAKEMLDHLEKSTDGSSIETKESALVCRDADPGFGFARAKEM